jgi:hypothetical protein
MSAQDFTHDSAASLDGLAAVQQALIRVQRPILTERSVKWIGKDCRPDRRLFSFPRGALGAGPSAHLRAIATQLGAPQDGFALLDQFQSQSVGVHLGLEPEASQTTLKIYLEFPDGHGPRGEPESEIQEDEIQESSVNFLALKWRPDGTWTHSFYRDKTRSPVHEQHQLILGNATPKIAGLLLHCLSEPGARLLEVREPGTPRISVDISIAEAQKTVGELMPELVAAMGTGVGNYLHRHKDDVFGHLAVGRARDGRDFVSLYHGVRRITGADL